MNTNELIPDFQIGSPVALMFGYLGCDRLACVSKFFLKFWLLQNSLDFDAAAERNERASGRGDRAINNDVLAVNQCGLGSRPMPPS